MLEFLLMIMYTNMRCLIYPGVAKFGIALGSGPRGRGFKSRHSDHEKHRPLWAVLFASEQVGANPLICSWNMKTNKIYQLLGGLLKVTA